MENTLLSEPVFVRGFSRSGGTLLVTLLDAHHRIAMSYEQYPNLLEKDDGTPLSLAELNEYLSSYAGRQKKSAPKFETFLNRVGRGGLSREDVAEVIGSFDAPDHGSPLPLEDRIRLIGSLAVVKQQREGKRRWGLKCNNRYEAYLGAFPKAKFLNITRDGRDVAASQMNTGSFSKGAAEVAKGWKQTHLCFKAFSEAYPSSCLQVCYERLVADPEGQLRAICDFLGEPWDTGMLHHQDKDLTVFGVSHLSGDRLKVAVDTSKVGRYKKDLSKGDLAAFEEVSGDLLRALGYGCDS